MELWDLYDHDRLPTGETHERGTPLPQGRYHMVVHVVIFNTKGEMLIQQRQPFKSGWPNLWDVTVGGSAIAGDTSRSAAQRETLEEIGLHIDLSSEQPKLTLPFDCGFDDIYTLVMDVDLTTLHLQESEVQAVKWASEEEILAMLADGRFIPYHRAFIQLLFALRNSRGAHVSQIG
jgi:isopentenyldiphosphate isomerase